MNITFGLALLINFAMLGSHSDLPDAVRTPLTYLTYPLCITHAVLSVLRMTSLLLKRGPLYVEQQQEQAEEHTDDDDDSDEEAASNWKQSQLLRPLVDWWQALYYSAHDALEATPTGRTVLNGLRLALGAAHEPVTVFTIFYVTFALLGVATLSPMWYSLLLFDIVQRSALLKETLSALKDYSSSLFATSLLWLVTCNNVN
jgi:small-conductance mechanosensitive channel